MKKGLKRILTGAMALSLCMTAAVSQSPVISEQTAITAKAAADEGWAQIGDSTTYYKFEGDTLYIEGKGAIPKQAFDNVSFNGLISVDKSIKKLVISEGIDEIGLFAFLGQREFEEIYLPDSMKKIAHGGLDCYSRNVKVSALCTLEYDEMWGIDITNLYPRHTDLDGDFICDVCGNLRERDFGDYVKGAGFSLEGKIGVRLFTNESSDSFTVVCKETGKTIDEIGSGSSSDGRYIDFYLAPKDMAATYTVTVNGTKRDLRPITILGVYKDTEYFGLVQSLTAYCKAADAYFDKNSGTHVENVDIEVPKYSDTITDTDSGNNYATSLILNYETALKVYITNPEGIEAAEGQTQESSKMISVKFDNIDVLNLGRQFVVEGSSFSALTYISKAANQEIDPDLANLAKSLYRYYLSAQDFA